MRALILSILLSLAPVFLWPADTPLAAADLSKRHRTWLEEEVRYIISDEERAYFLTLNDDAARDAFINAFWKSHDPTPLTLENEFKKEHYARLKSAEERFGDTGQNVNGISPEQVYILLGEPEEEYTFSDARLKQELTAWKYSPYPVLGIEDSFYLLWVEDEKTGNLRVFRSGMQEPRYILDPSVVRTPESNLREVFLVDTLLGHIVLSHLSSDHQPLMINNRAEMRRALSRRGNYHIKLMQQLSNGRNINSERRFKRILAYLEGQRSTGTIDYAPVADLDIAHNVFALFTEEGRRQLFLAYQMDGKELGLKDYFGRCYGVLNFSINIYHQDGRLVSALNDFVSISFLASDLARGHSGKLVHLAALDLPAGEYRAETVIRNPLNKTMITLKKPFAIKNLNGEEVAISEPLFLLRGLSQQALETAKSGLLYYPSPDMVLERGENAELFFQISGSRRVLSSEAIIRYRATHGKRLIWRHQERIVLRNNDDSGVFTHKLPFPTRRFAPGDYTLEVSVESAAGAQDEEVCQFKVDHRMHNSAVTVLAHSTQ